MPMTTSPPTVPDRMRDNGAGGRKRTHRADGALDEWRRKFELMVRLDPVGLDALGEVRTPRWHADRLPGDAVSPGRRRARRQGQLQRPSGRAREADDRPTPPCLRIGRSCDSARPETLAAE